MSGIANSINRYIDYSNKVLTPEETKLPFMEVINRANNEEQNFNFKKALAFYQLALTMKDDDNFPSMVSRIYPKIAKCYEQTSDWFNALKYYDMAFDYYTTAGDIERVNEIRLRIANIFYITYKHDKAKLILNDIISSKENISHDIRIKAHIAMANISGDDLKSAYNNYKKAFELIEPRTNKKLLAELYFKFGAVCDEIDETEAAVKLYKRCLDITKDNEYLSSAMVNLAMIFDDTGAKDLAIKYYKESLRLDETNHNLSGIYISSTKLAELYRRKEPDTAFEYFKKSVETAKALEDPYYIVRSNVELGDFCIIRKDYKTALASYLNALQKTDEKATLKNREKIETRINDLRIRLGTEEFDKLEKEITNG